MEIQFQNEPISQIPYPNIAYYYKKDFVTKGFTYLMKLVLLTKKYPELINEIQNYKDQVNAGPIPPLYIACANSCSSEVVKQLINCGADVNSHLQGTTALMMACSTNNLEAVKELIKNGADINKIESQYSGNTALMYACEKSNVEIVKELLEAGAYICPMGEKNTHRYK